MKSYLPILSSKNIKSISISPEGIWAEPLLRKGFKLRSSIVVFPASNCDRDIAVALESVTGTKPEMVWHGDADLPKTDLIILPGGFSYGDYLRAGAMAARSPIMGDVIRKAKQGTPVLGVCNGFQILTETGLLPGALMRNANLKFIHKTVVLQVENNRTIFTARYDSEARLAIPIAHQDGNYFADDATLDRLEGESCVVFRYLDNPNGSARNIAGIVSENGRILGMMPHPERASASLLGGVDGIPVFESLMEALS